MASNSNPENSDQAPSGKSESDARRRESNERGDTKTGEMSPPKQKPDSEPRGRGDVVDEASFESFPASDPPVWATGQLRRSEDDAPERSES